MTSKFVLRNILSRKKIHCHVDKTCSTKRAEQELDEFSFRGNRRNNAGAVRNIYVKN